MSRRRALELCAIVVLLLCGTLARVRVSRGWVYAGSDTYAYVRLGDQWLEHGRFALGPTEPLEWYRRPLYPLFVHAVRYGTHADAAGDAGWPGWIRVEHAQIAIDVFCTGLLVLFVARRLGGPIAGLAALALAMLWPPSVLFSCAVLTEPMMALLTMATVACLILGRARPQRWFPVAAVLVALAAYLRPDGPINAVAWLPALLFVDGWKRRATVVATSLLLFAVLFAPWPLRNLARFGTPHLADGMVDRHGHDVPHYAGFWRWLQSWARDHRPAGYPQSCFYDVKCEPTHELFEEEGAFVAPGTSGESERRKVDELLAWRRQEGVSARVSDGFAKIARDRRARHPFRVLVALPLARAWRMWSAPQTELIEDARWRPWPAVMNPVFGKLRLLSLVLVAAVVAAAATLLAVRRTRIAAAILVTTVVARTAVLAWSAFCLPRYLVPLYPVCFVLVGAALGVGLRALGDARRQRAARASRTIARSRCQRNSGPRVTTTTSS